jgi:hypothetical protein
VVTKLTEAIFKEYISDILRSGQGKEKNPTFFLHGNRNMPDHTYYCFASADIPYKVQNAEIGAYENWIAHSDHLRLTIDLDF